MIDKAGHIVTNYHVVEGATEIEIGFSNHDTRKASIIGVDPSTDLAVLKVEAAPGPTPLPLADSDGVQVGDQVVAIGNPFGLERTATLGIVSALQRAVTAPNGYTIDHVIQTDAPINRGNSGGPLIDMHGRVIGVNSQIETGGEGAVGNVGIGFAVPSNTVKTVVAQLLDTGRVDRAYVGVLATTVTPELARVFRLPVDNGLLLERVEPTSPAANAGLKGGTTRRRGRGGGVPARRRPGGRGRRSVSAPSPSSATRSQRTGRATRSKSSSTAATRSRPSAPPGASRLQQRQATRPAGPLPPLGPARGLGPNPLEGPVWARGQFLSRPVRAATAEALRPPRGSRRSIRPRFTFHGARSARRGTSGRVPARRVAVTIVRGSRRSCRNEARGGEPLSTASRTRYAARAPHGGQVSPAVSRRSSSSSATTRRAGQRGAPRVLCCA